MLCGTSNPQLLWMVTLRGWWDLVLANHTFHEVRSVQGMGEENWSEGISSALGIPAPSSLAEKRGEEVVGRAKGEEDEAAGSELRETVSIPVSSSKTWLQKGLTLRKGDPKLQQTRQPLIVQNRFLTDDLFL